MKRLLIIFLCTLSCFTHSAFAIPNEPMTAKLKGTSWFCKGNNKGMFFDEDYSFYTLSKLVCVNTQDKGYLIEHDFYTYQWIDDNQIWICYTDILCDDESPSAKLSVEKFTDSFLDVQVIWKEEWYNCLNCPVGTKLHFVRNENVPIYTNDDLVQKDTVVIDSTFQLPRVKVVYSELQNSIIDFWNQTRKTSEPSYFLEARFSIKNDSVIVTITDEVTFPYLGHKNYCGKKNVKTKSLAMVADSIPVVFIGDWSKQFLRKSRGNYPLTLCYNKYINCLSIEYEPCAEYLKGGTVTTKKYPKLNAIQVFFRRIFSSN